MWDLRAADMDLSKYGWFERRTFAMTRRLAGVPERIVVNSSAGLKHHLDHGYPADRMVLINNGIDTDYFKPDPDGRKRVRAEWGVSADRLLVGFAGRDDPAKDHRTFVKAAAHAARALPEVSFACIGTSAPWFDSLVASSDIAGRTVVTGTRADMPALYSAFDIVVSSSETEGFPNVVAEALACATPSIATDAGDSRLIIGDDSMIVDVRDGRALGETLLRELAKGKDALKQAGMRGRQRVTKEFSIATMVDNYQHTYQEAIALCAASAAR